MLVVLCACWSIRKRLKMNGGCQVILVGNHGFFGTGGVSC